jgi:predicted dehydrogenase
MGTRHLAGLVALTKAGLSDFELVGACDTDADRAETLAKSAGERLDREVAAVDAMEKLERLEVQAIDLTTAPWIHHTLAIQAMERGWHVMVEKPMGVTVKACNLMLKAAEKSKSVLNVAENFHYDPMNRIGRELIKKEVIGKPRFMLHNSVGGGDWIIVTPWRHYKRGGGPILDVGVHNTYVTEYMMGDVEKVYAHARLYEKIRRNRSGAEPAIIEADAEDAVYATFLFSNGSVCQYIEDHAGHGQGLRQRVVYGSKGSLSLPGDRSGNPVVMNLDGKGTIDNESILDFIPDFSLDETTAKLFGGNRIWHYDMPFPEIDSGLLAVEYADFARSIIENKPSEVDLVKAARAVAVPYAMLESSKLGRAVTVEEVMNEEISDYQDEVNRDIGLI